MTAFDEFIETLYGRRPMPVSKFLCYKGTLREDQLGRVLEVLRANKVAGGIRLEGCKLGDSGANWVAEALCENTKLDTIELPGNDITVAGVWDFLDTLYDNRTITTLDFIGNPCEDAYSEWYGRLSMYLCKNRGGASPPPLGHVAHSNTPSGMTTFIATPLSRTPSDTLASWRRQSSTPSPQPYRLIDQATPPTTSHSNTSLIPMLTPTVSPSLATSVTPRTSTSPTYSIFSEVVFSPLDATALWRSPTPTPSSPIPARSPSPTSSSPSLPPSSSPLKAPLKSASPAKSPWSNSSSTTQSPSVTPSPGPPPTASPAASRSSTPLAMASTPAASRLPLHSLPSTENLVSSEQANQADGKMAAAATQYEQRLHKLETMHSAITGDVNIVKGHHVNMEGWKENVDAASIQVASVLGSLQNQIEDVRSFQKAYKEWRAQVEGAGSEMSASVSQMREAWQVMKERVDLFAQEHRQPLHTLQEEQAQQQTQIKLLLEDVAVLQNDRDVLAEETGVSQNISGVEMHNKIVQLESECDHFQEVTDRLDRYIEEMLRTMLGTLDQGQSRLGVEVQKLVTRVAKTEAKQALLADQYDRILQGQAQHFAGGLQPQTPALCHIIERLQRAEAALGLNSIPLAPFSTITPPATALCPATTQHSQPPTMHHDAAHQREHDSDSDDESHIEFESTLSPVQHSPQLQRPSRVPRLNMAAAMSSPEKSSVAEALCVLPLSPAADPQNFTSPTAFQHEQADTLPASHSFDHDAAVVVSSVPSEQEEAASVSQTAHSATMAAPAMSDSDQIAGPHESDTALTAAVAVSIDQPQQPAASTSQASNESEHVSATATATEGFQATSSSAALEPSAPSSSGQDVQLSYMDYTSAAPSPRQPSSSAADRPQLPSLMPELVTRTDAFTEGREKLSIDSVFTIQDSVLTRSPSVPARKGRKIFGIRFGFRDGRFL